MRAPGCISSGSKTAYAALPTRPFGSAYASLQLLPEQCCLTSLAKPVPSVLAHGLIQECHAQICAHSLVTSCSHLKKRDNPRANQLCRVQTSLMLKLGTRYLVVGESLFEFLHELSVAP